MKRLRLALILLSVGLVAIPAAIVILTEKGWGSITADILVSLSIVSLIGATLIGIDRKNKPGFYTKLGISIGLLLVALSLWI